jgi:methyltransferase (TIGR00027 family)
MRADRPSRTAVLIAAATVFLSRDPELALLVPSEAATWCRLLLKEDPLVKTLLHPALRWFVRLAERATVPGLMLHFMLRKRWIEEAVREGLVQGCREVVVIGAGFDTLCVRLAGEFPRVTFIEVDHPATQRRKRAALPPELHNLRLVEVDLAQQKLEEVCRPRNDAAVVIEGLLMYLTEAQVGRLFSALKDCRRIVFTVMDAPAFRNATPLVSRLLAAWREPFKSSLRPGEAPAFVERFGFRLRSVTGDEDLRKRYLDGRRDRALAQGEIILVADRL